MRQIKAKVAENWILVTILSDSHDLPLTKTLPLKTVKLGHLFQKSHFSYLDPNDSLTSEAVHT